MLALERRDSAAFQPLPFHYVEMAHSLFTAGTDEALPAEVFGGDVSRVKDLVELVHKARMNKIMTGLATLQGAMTVKLNNLSAMEVNTVRPFFLGALDMFQEYQSVSGEGEGRREGGRRARGACGWESAPARQRPPGGCCSRDIRLQRGGSLQGAHWWPAGCACRWRRAASRAAAGKTR